MAKGQVTSDDLATGIKSFGGLSSLSGSARPVRDNPFRDTRAEPSPPVAVAMPVLVPPQPEPTPAAPPEPEPPRLEVITRREEPAGAQVTEEGRGEPPAPAKIIERKPSAVPTPKRSTPLPQPTVRAAESKPADTQREKKTEIYTERVTVLMSAEMRDRSEALAKDIHRHRTQKGERITSNTVIRVAIRAMLDTFEPGTEISLNTESDLYDAFVKRLGRTK